VTFSVPASLVLEIELAANKRRRARRYLPVRRRSESRAGMRAFWTKIVDARPFRRRDDP